MLRRAFTGIVGLVLLGIGVFFASIITYLGFSEILPAFEKGSFNVETNSMILNRVWENNEIYLVLTAYALLAGVFVYGAIRLLKKAIAGDDRRSPTASGR